MNEAKLISIAKPYMDKCRSGDWNHALRVVDWVKILGKGRADVDLLIVAAYIHDIGWAGILPEGKVNFDEMLQFESQANENSDRLVKEVLNKIGFTEDRIKKIIRLIAAADKHESTEDDEEIIVDADSLSKLCKEHVEEKYAEESYRKIIGLWEKEFPNRLKTAQAKSLYHEMLVNLKKQLSIDS